MNAFNGRLTSRHRECLQLVATNHSTKEIAKLLVLSPNTVDGYISEAKEILGAATRREAARIFNERPVEKAPQKIGGEFSRVEQTDALPSVSSSASLTGQRSAMKHLLAVEEVQSDSPPSASFHWFRGDRAHNTLSVGQRLIWIGAATFAAAILFLISIAIIDSLARLVFLRSS